MSGDEGRPTASSWGKSPLHEQSSRKGPERVGNETETTQSHHMEWSSRTWHRWRIWWNEHPCWSNSK